MRSSLHLQVTGIRLSIFSRIASSVFFAVLVSIGANWEFALFVVIIFPLLVLIGILEVQLLKGQVKKNKENLEESGQLTVESIDNIRTVVGLGAEEAFLNKYKNLLAAPFK